uniref:valine--tRNA ligase n=1 Tax=Parascaris equorum TaxID=6256 RepID=A0A914SHM4_PAREQ
MSSYAFHQATSAMYNFWLYDFCDIYIEGSKPVLLNGGANVVSTTRQILYTCVDTGLRLISPIMPFISEELWQRLPRRPSAHKQPLMYVTFMEKEEADAVGDLVTLISTLTSSQMVSILTGDQDSEIPKGCAQITVSARCKASLALQKDSLCIELKHINEAIAALEASE